ncbi:TetR family transcriptional regulator [Chryseobacterium sp. 6424]|uniref:TetR/AcrR family transcriptional regulator n=1 Tax=Chryseobacterium sp. 6424 TaxID=2039166 RepID=UPI000EFA4BCB|nr:TetR/AcrR family transcriptional regulator [Chryseobacterium sp. 6424]AYO57735.1 TetR family transcriptional regulator [Chryseobacterium sp. 6424]
MEDKQFFLTKASELFIENGPKAVTMDDIAAAFGISKKKLYQMFRNKEELLEEILRYNLDLVISKLNYLDENIESAIERMFCRDEEIEKMSHSNKTLMIRQLLKYYPAIFNKHMLDFSEKFAHVMVKNIEKGRRQGYYRDDFDAEVYAKIFFQLVMSYDNSPYIDINMISRAHYKEELMMMYMHAITTEKGKETIKKIKNNQ